MFFTLTWTKRNPVLPLHHISHTPLYPISISHTLNLFRLKAVCPRQERKKNVFSPQSLVSSSLRVKNPHRYSLYVYVCLQLTNLSSNSKVTNGEEFFVLKRERERDRTKLERQRKQKRQMQKARKESEERFVKRIQSKVRVDLSPCPPPSLSRSLTHTYIYTSRYTFIWGLAILYSTCE